MVNSESGFNENYFEEVKENLDKLEIMKQRGSSMPELERGGKVGYVNHESDKEYEIGYIIVYYRDGVKIFHEVVAYEDIDSGGIYTTFFHP